MHETSRFREVDYQFVVECWDASRSAMTYDYYYGDRLRSLTSKNLWSEILIAATATGGLISGWTIWTAEIGKYAVGHWIWSILAGVAALVALAKPYVRWDLEIKNLTELQQQYRSINSAIGAIIFSIRMAGAVTPEHQTRLEKQMERAAEAYRKSPPKPENKLLERSQNRVLQEKPIAGLWVPYFMSAPVAIDSRSGSPA